MANVKLNVFHGYYGLETGDLSKKLDITDWTIRSTGTGIRYDNPLNSGTGLAEWLIVTQTPATDTSPSIQTVEYFSIAARGRSQLQFTIETETTELELPRTNDLIGYLLQGNDVVEGSTWKDDIVGAAGDDVLNGNDGSDRIEGGAGNDILNGGEHSDTLVGGAGADTIDGGNGSDDVSYKASSTAVKINLIANTFSGGDAEGDQVINVEGWALSEHDDLMIGSDKTDKIYGLGGNDLIFGNKGDDYIYGGDGDDTLVLGEGGGSLYGGNGNDALFAGDQGVYIAGGDGNDWIFAGEGKDFIYGGKGVDWISFTNAGSGVSASASGKASSQVPQTGDAVGDTYRDIENIHGSAFDDHLVSSDGDGTIVGWDGNDKLVGSDGSNTLLGDNGNDQLLGGKGDDFLLGGAGNDVVRGDIGNDYVDGGDGNDTLSAISGKNVFFDGAGNDRIFGGVDDDYVVLGGGQDIVYGGNGNDMVRVSTTGNTLWHDFQSGENRLDLTYTTISRSEFESTARDSADGLELDTGDGWITLADTSLETFDFDDDVLYGA